MRELKWDELENKWEKEEKREKGGQSQAISESGNTQYGLRQSEVQQSRAKLTNSISITKVQIINQIC